MRQRGDRASEYDRAVAWLVAVCRVADRVQPDRAHRGAGADPDGKGAEYRSDGMVALAGGVLSGKYQGSAGTGKEAEAGRMSSEMMKDFLPEQQRTERVVAAVKGLQAKLTQYGAGGAGVAAFTGRCR